MALVMPNGDDATLQVIINRPGYIPHCLAITLGAAALESTGEVHPALMWRHTCPAGRSVFVGPEMPGFVIEPGMTCGNQVTKYLFSYVIDKQHVYVRVVNIIKIIEEGPERSSIAAFGMVNTLKNMITFQCYVRPWHMRLLDSVQRHPLATGRRIKRRIGIQQLRYLLAVLTGTWVDLVGKQEHVDSVALEEVFLDRFVQRLGELDIFVGCDGKQRDFHFPHTVAILDLRSNLTTSRRALMFLYK